MLSVSALKLAKVRAALFSLLLSAFKVCLRLESFLSTLTFAFLGFTSGLILLNHKSILTYMVDDVTESTKLMLQLVVPGVFSSCRTILLT